MNIYAFTINSQNYEFTSNFPSYIHSNFLLSSKLKVYERLKKMCKDSFGPTRISLIVCELCIH